MKREGRQHGLVRTYRILPSPWNPRPESRAVIKLDSPPTFGLLTKVARKPSNHSKFTGKCGRPRCGECHIRPACKSKDKTKGTHKLLDSGDLVSNHKLISWRVVDGRPGLNFSGFSATGILDHLASDCVDDDTDDDVHDHDHHDDPHDRGDEIREIAVEDEEEDGDKGKAVNQDLTSYFDVAFDQVYEEDEGWCLLGET